MNKPKLNDLDVETTTTKPIIETQCTSCSKYPLKNYKINFKEQEEQKIIQEANELGYEYLKNDFYIDLTRGTKRITIDIQELDYSCFDTELNVDLSINCEEHLLLTKILTYLGGL